MKWYLGIDGGGSKTAFTIGRTSGEAVYTHTLSGCSYQLIGPEAVRDLLARGVRTCLEAVGADREDCAGCCVGLPCFGENKRMDRVLQNLLEEALAPIPLLLVNDGVAGWAGSLECREGIHLVTGTGSLAIGRGAEGSFARSGGWVEFFGDEGSCYWVGREAMSLFSKEADGRLPRGPLYRLVREKYGLNEDFEFVETVLQKLAPYRDRVADFQRLALEAAAAGDRPVQDLYRRAAGELAQMVFSVKEQLLWTEREVPVSYFGGLFHAGSWILEPLAEELTALGCVLRSPAHTAAEGALLLAINQFAKEGNACF